jgi:Spy/CpxP family protein refolding chaperone
MNNTFKKPGFLTILSLGLTALLFATLVNAEELKQQGEHQNKKEMSQKLIKEQLQLDDSTAQALQKLMKKHRSEQREFHEKNREARKLIRDKHQAKLKALLGENKFLEFEKIMKSKFKEHRKNKRSRQEESEQVK